MHHQTGLQNITIITINIITIYKNIAKNNGNNFNHNLSFIAVRLSYNTIRRIC